MDSRSGRGRRAGKYAAAGGLLPPRTRPRFAPDTLAAASAPRRPPIVRSGLALLTGAALFVPGVGASAPIARTAAYQGTLGVADGARTGTDLGAPAEAGAGAQGGPDSEATSGWVPGAPDATEPFDALPDLATVQVDFNPPSQAALLASGFVLPVRGVPTSPFGLRLHPIQHVWKLHSGQDLAAPCGTPVVAVKDATVTFVGRLGGYGGRVVLNHGGGLETAYSHLSAYAAVPGLTVRQGQVIGFVGTTGMSTGCHLHFEVKINGAFVDPAPYLGMAPAPPVVIPPAVTPTPVGPGPTTSTLTSTSTPSSPSTLPPTAPRPSTPTTTSPIATTPTPRASATNNCPTTPPGGPTTASPTTGWCPTAEGTPTTSPTTSTTSDPTTRPGAPTPTSKNTGTTGVAATATPTSGAGAMSTAPTTPRASVRGTATVTSPAAIPTRAA